MLWSDPQKREGRASSSRGAGVKFGEDVTIEFLHNNNLKTIIRSHECVPKGYEVAHGYRVTSPLPPPNYRTNPFLEKANFPKMNSAYYCFFGLKLLWHE